MVVSLETENRTALWYNSTSYKSGKVHLGTVIPHTNWESAKNTLYTVVFYKNGNTTWHLNTVGPSGLVNKEEENTRKQKLHFGNVVLHINWLSAKIRQIQ